MESLSQTVLDEKDATLSDLLDRAERGEVVTISRNGHPVARILPVPEPRDPEKARAVIEDIRSLREQIRQESGPITTAEILELIREGRCY